MKCFRSMVLVLVVLMGSTLSGWAQVRVTKGAGQKSAFDLSGFTAGGGAAPVFRKTLESDLVRSGWFLIVGTGRGEFRLLGAADDAGASVEAKCQVFDTVSGKSYLSKSYKAGSKDARRLAHQVADEIIFAISGRKGMNSGRIAMVGTASGHKELYLCDPDGQNIVQLTRDNNVSVAPKWSPDGKQIVYTSYIKRFPDVYLIDIASGRRSRISSYSGLNTGAEISPDGRDVALVLSKDGNPDLYIKGLGGGSATRVTTTPRAAEASPAWSPDGSRIAYVSDSSGTPQLYVISRGGGKASRLTSRGYENVAPDWGKNGLIAYSSRLGGRYQVCVIDPNSLEIKQVSTDDADYEDPCWAPDGRHIVCTRTRQYRAGVYLLDTMGDPPIALIEHSGDWYSPSWSAK